MDPKVFENLTLVAKAMDGFNEAIDAWIEELRRAGGSPERIGQLSGSAKAMRDSASIYLAWAEHLANGLPQEEGVEPETRI